MVASTASSYSFNICPWWLDVVCLHVGTLLQGDATPSSFQESFLWLRKVLCWLYLFGDLVLSLLSIFQSRNRPTCLLMLVHLEKGSEGLHALFWNMNLLFVSPERSWSSCLRSLCLIYGIDSVMSKSSLRFLKSECRIRWVETEFWRPLHLVVWTTHFHPWRAYLRSRNLNPMSESMAYLLESGCTCL